MPVQEEWVATPDCKLYTRTWLPDKLKATVVFVHGLGEHVTRYDEMFGRFADNGIKVTAFDQRGHSMGGGLTLGYALQNQKEFQGVIASAPLVDSGDKTKPKLADRILLSFVPYILPSFVIPNILDLSTLSRDPNEVALYKKDPLVHSYISTGLCNDILTNGTNLLRNAKKFNLPLLVAHGTQDGMTCPKASKKFVSLVSSNDKTYKEYEGFYHELHNEPRKDREIVYDTYINWITERI
ncbi:hypothetical protein HK103_004806 [Boothiomyces macroporosus]|uniref:Serine aminopeptidase S33 domain-containing protein n=1 Tax=Boothiomyces macroporosus TaxID=261099 RepID=A0AAD5UG89_9FUNG|nr:hypothetical protein HK103_004806 [Boothiomyces macroporosus]